MQLYNALTQKVEPFEPIGEAVTIYVCGITPYDTTHMGHCFTYVSFDVLIRYLESLGYPVKYTQNVTDIDDDILRKAGEVGDDWIAIGNPPPIMTSPILTARLLRRYAIPGWLPASGSEL